MIQKTNRLLQIFLGAFLLIAFRIWHLAVFQREEKLIEAQKPQRRTLIERADRGSIVDRFGIPLALNRICYRASIYYSEFAQIPSSAWKIDKRGNRIRTFPRKEYILHLSELLSKELGMDAERIEDLIYSKASLFPHVPFVIQSNLTERQHFRLKSLEREWIGLHAEITSERFYPMGKTASHILGHLGAISQDEYFAFCSELDSLQQMILDGGEEDSLMRRYSELKERAYTINDLVGKTGIEKSYEQALRGFYGKKTFEIDQSGKSLRELTGGKAPVAGQTVKLSISAELQQFCETLLIQDEKTREGRSIGVHTETKTRKILKQPWIKGGAIVALDPATGEVLALAGVPRFDPNDFIPTSKREEKIQKIRRWQENERYIADLWDGKAMLLREKLAQDEQTRLSWDLFLQWTHPTDGPLRAFWNRVDDLKKAIQLQEDFEALLYFAKGLSPMQLIDQLFPEGHAHRSHEAGPKRRLTSLLEGILSNSDKLFALDLCRTAVYAPAFTDELIAKIGSQKISTHRNQTQALQRVEDALRQHSIALFHRTQFRAWRNLHQKEFLKQKREEEKARKTYARPYIDYLDKKEKALFEELWQQIRFPLLAAILKQDPSLLSEEAQPFFDVSLQGLSDWEPLRTASLSLTGEESLQWLKTMRPFQNLDRPLWGSYRSLRGKRGEQIERDLAAAFYPIGGFGYCRSHAYQSAAPLGSLFKLVTAYEALRQRGPSSLPTLTDEVRFDEKKQLIVATGSDRKPFYRHYKGGRLPRSHLPHLGKVDLIGALEQSSNPYFALLAGDFLADPEDLTRIAADFGFGQRTGIELPGELKGNLPTDIKTNRTGLYSFAIGQHTLVVTPLQSALMLNTFANNGKLLTPQLVCSVKGSHPEHTTLTGFTKKTFLADKELSFIGIDFPLFLSAESNRKVFRSEKKMQQVRRTLFLSPQIRSYLFEGMDRVIWGPKGSARPSAIKGLYGNPLLLREFFALQHQMIGKTSTAEVLSRLDCNPSAAAQMYKHIWFGAISFEPSSDRWEKPELVIAVYLRYGDGGKEAAPIAAQVIKKWREISKKKLQCDDFDSLTFPASE